jgi:Ran-binding protein 9/10
LPPDKLPGWTSESWGYHGDDGNIFHGESGQAIGNYGVLFSTGDVIGCCLDFQNDQVFYTKNGEYLGLAFSGEAQCWGPNLGELYPCVGLHSIGERVRINLGKEKFVFNILEYAESSV